MFNIICSLILPLIVLVVVLYGIVKGRNVYDDFIEGAKQSFDIVLSMFPCLLAMIFAINIILDSSFINFILQFLKPVLNVLKIPFDILPMAIMRPISGSSALAILNNILSVHGPDSLIGRMASVIQGSTDTTLYVLTLYFGSIGIKKIRYSLIAGLFADLIGIIASIVIVNIMF